MSAHRPGSARSALRPAAAIVSSWLLTALLVLSAFAAQARAPAVPADALRGELGARVERSLQSSEQRGVRFEAVEISHWKLGAKHAEFVLWGLLREDDRPARMLRVEGLLDRRSLALGELRLQSFDELQALGPVQRR